MSTIDTHAASTTAASTLPPGPRIPKALQGIAFAFVRRRFMHEMAHRYGDAFSLHVPVIVFVQREHRSGSEQSAQVGLNVAEHFRAGSVYALDKDDHRQRR